MLALIIGGNGSGKSEFAENMALNLSKQNLIYLATMIPYGREGTERVEKHKKMRRDKGFKTIEKYTGLKKLTLKQESTVLLECMSNLLANEMFENDGAGDKSVEEIIIGIDNLINCTENTVIVSNDIFGDGINYDGKTREYINNLGLINRYISLKADMIYEIVCGIPIVIKENYIC